MRAAAALTALLVFAALAPASRAQPAGLDDGAVFERLPPQPFPDGACIMALWARRGDEAERILVGYAHPPRMRAKLSGEVIELRRIRASGAQAFGFYENQTFARSGHRIEINATFKAEAQVTEGAVIERGSVTYTSPQQWSITTPVAGLTACKPRS